MKNFAGKTAVVTGGASGIGRSLVERLAREQMRVAVVDVRQEEAEAAAARIRAAGGEATAVRADVTDRADLARAAAFIEQLYGPPHLLCNNAGVITFKPFETLEDSDWDWDLAVNLRGAVDVVRAFLPGMLGQTGERHIVTTASIGGLVAGFTDDIVPYTVSKFGIVGFCEALRLELAPKGIGVSVLCPGGVRTDIILSGQRRPLAAGGPMEINLERHKQIQDAGLDPKTVADMVMEGVKDDRLYIFTSRQTRDRMDLRIQSIKEGYEALNEYLDSRLGHAPSRQASEPDLEQCPVDGILHPLR